jgi:hypothetical protein
MSEFAGCPGSRAMDFRKRETPEEASMAKVQSQLRQWPIQLHLVSPVAPYYQGADVLLTADCVAYALGGFHNDYLKGKSLAIACPKLDEGQDVYAEKIKSWFEKAKINTLTVLIMQVPGQASSGRVYKEGARQISSCWPAGRNFVRRLDINFSPAHGKNGFQQLQMG